MVSFPHTSAFARSGKPMSKYVVNIAWSDVPHLTEEMKATMRVGIMPYQLEAREKGIPVLGAGAIYPVQETEIIVDPFEIPKHWPRAYAMDVGWNRTAALWGALDRESDCLYWYSEHYLGHEKPPMHASAIKARGDWMNGVIDPASRGRTQTDGAQLYADYIALGLKLSFANNSIESGIYDVWERKTTGRLKVFSTLRNYLFEHRLYRRDEHGKVVKTNDHLMDCERYFCASAVHVMLPIPGQLGNRKAAVSMHKTEWSPLDALAKESNS